MASLFLKKHLKKKNRNPYMKRVKYVRRFLVISIFTACIYLALTPTTISLGQTWGGIALFIAALLLVATGFGIYKQKAMMYPAVYILHSLGIIEAILSAYVLVTQNATFGAYISLALILALHISAIILARKIQPKIKK